MCEKYNLKFSDFLNHTNIQLFMEFFATIILAGTGAIQNPGIVFKVPKKKQCLRPFFAKSKIE